MKISLLAMVSLSWCFDIFKYLKIITIELGKVTDTCACMHRKCLETKQEKLKINNRGSAVHKNCVMIWIGMEKVDSLFIQQ